MEILFSMFDYVAKNQRKLNQVKNAKFFISQIG